MTKVLPIALAVAAVVFTGGAALGVLPTFATAMAGVVGGLGLSAGAATALTGALVGAGFGGAIGFATSGGKLAGLQKGALLGGVTGGLGMINGIDGVSSALAKQAAGQSFQGGLDAIVAGNEASLASTMGGVGAGDAAISGGLAADTAGATASGMVGDAAASAGGSAVGSVGDAITSAGAAPLTTTSVMPSSLLAGGGAGTATSAATGAGLPMITPGGVASATGAGGTTGAVQAASAGGGLLGGSNSLPMAMALSGLGKGLMASNPVTDYTKELEATGANYKVDPSVLLTPNYAAGQTSIPDPSQRFSPSYYAPSQPQFRYVYDPKAGRIVAQPVGA